MSGLHGKFCACPDCMPDAGDEIERNTLDALTLLSQRNADPDLPDPEGWAAGGLDYLIRKGYATNLGNGRFRITEAGRVVMHRLARKLRK